MDEQIPAPAAAGMDEKYLRTLKPMSLAREDYEQKSFQDIMAYQSQVVEAGLPWEIIEIFLKKVYKRSK